MKKTNRPTQVRVGHLVFEVSYVSDRDWVKLEFLDPNACGQTFGQLAQIWIRVYKRQPEAVTKETLLHEILHAAFYVTGLSAKKDTEEVIVRSLSPVLMSVIIDNPETAAYLIAS